MLDLLRPYRALVLLALLAALVIGAIYSVRRYDAHQQSIGEARERAAWTDKALAAEKAVRERETTLQKEKDHAIAQAQKDRDQAARAAAAARDSGRVLSDTIQTVRERAAADTDTAARRYASTLAAVFDECQAAYRDVAAEADGHAGDSLMLQRAWPR